MSVLNGQIKGNFEGFKDTETIFELMDGSKWKQDEYKFLYSFSFMPKVQIVQEVGRYYLSVDGECKNGYAEGLGREIEKDTLMDQWGLAIYKNGIPTYYVINDVLRNIVDEKVDNADEMIAYGVRTSIIEKNGDIDVRTNAFLVNHKDYITMFLETSPFWNGTYVSIKRYPNFDYVYLDDKNNDISLMDFSFFISTKNSKNGWAIGKPKNQNIATGEYVDNKLTKVELPSIYKQKADEIIKEISQAAQKAYKAQEEALLVKKQYMNKICKDSVKITFMDNEEYKAICNNQKEKELYTKINNKLEKLTKEKIARLEQKKYDEQQKQQEQYRQQQLAMERQRLEAQQAQAAALQSQAAEMSVNNFNQSMQNMTNNLQNMNSNMQMQQLNNNLTGMRYGY